MISVVLREIPFSFTPVNLRTTNLWPHRKTNNFYKSLQFVKQSALSFGRSLSESFKFRSNARNTIVNDEYDTGTFQPPGNSPDKLLLKLDHDSQVYMVLHVRL